MRNQWSEVLRARRSAALRAHKRCCNLTCLTRADCQWAQECQVGERARVARCLAPEIASKQLFLTLDDYITRTALLQSSAVPIAGARLVPYDNL